MVDLAVKHTSVRLNLFGGNSSFFYAKHRPKSVCFEIAHQIPNPPLCIDWVFREALVTYLKLHS